MGIDSSIIAIYSTVIKGFITVEYVVLFNEADGQDTFWTHFSKNIVTI